MLLVFVFGDCSSAYPAIVAGFRAAPLEAHYPDALLVVPPR
ncbi:MAG TPA: hypothetical protein VL524_12405 [Gemmatimonadaceae bacterium]|nr:hypothetical protein [Gemmatimonadaceae bacterium]